MRNRRQRKRELLTLMQTSGVAWFFWLHAFASSLPDSLSLCFSLTALVMVLPYGDCCCSPHASNGLLS